MSEIQREIHCDDWGHVYGGILGEPGRHGQTCDCGKETYIDPIVVEAERRGEARILQAIAKLPNPWKPDLSGFQFCDWCDAKVEMPYYEDAETAECGYRMVPHPDNGCLYARALASATGTETP